jgi:hypothetical protein
VLGNFELGRRLGLTPLAEEEDSAGIFQGTAAPGISILLHAFAAVSFVYSLSSSGADESLKQIESTLWREWRSPAYYVRVTPHTPSS